MAVTKANNIYHMTADDDTIDFGARTKIKVKGVRLIAGDGAAAVAILKVDDTNGNVLCKLKCAQATDTESAISFFCDSGKIHLDLSGASAEVLVYLE